MSDHDNLNFDGAEWVNDAYFVKTQQDIPTSFKEHIEKPISDKVLGKLKDRDR